MGGSSNPIAKVVKAVTDTVDTGGKALGDTINTAGKAIEDTSRQVGRLDKIILSPTNAKEEAAKDADRADQRQREAAMSAQEEASLNLRRQQSSNDQKGSSIILGNKGKKKRGSSGVSSGMGLSKGSTGLQT